MMYTPILATLGFILSQDEKKTLMIHRNKRLGDPHYGKYNGLGGKMERQEDIFSCLKREVYEESGLLCEDATLRGTVNWAGFGSKGEDWFGFIYRIDRFSGELQASNEEGDLQWCRLNELHLLPMWEGDKYFLDMVFDDDPRIFYGCMPYRDGRPLSWHYSRG
ncbi:MAG: 8-oxo-dGTP diphosphatase [Proteobacteria bacterium]|nr:8-oxo-dGTP diphosphatase [Desulfocapsa sp.]MBU3945403.1 8-oxo-dGTP diphosphatase [Pseudomonadota bacterium]MCG2744143.1 8-oxo-dGTP diphosphatase [Desulfobacteraceae bacterium]MBU3982950.1 8-oxo-dGTP diphosphatase [Pseudomonadota bacterium]MBU4028145.1 8-oxo-dGTP diphosphatase [Pseudomonadota bacterium]